MLDGLPFAQSPSPEESVEFSGDVRTCAELHAVETVNEKPSAAPKSTGNVRNRPSHHRRSRFVLTNTSIDCMEIAACSTPPLLSAKNLVPETGDDAPDNLPFSGVPMIGVASQTAPGNLLVLGGPRTELAMRPAPGHAMRLTFNSIGSSNPLGTENLSSTWDLTRSSNPLHRATDTCSSTDDSVDGSSALNSWRSAPAILSDTEQYYFELFHLEGIPVARSPAASSADVHLGHPFLPPQTAPQLRGSRETPLHAARFVAHPADACLQRSVRDTPPRQQLPGSLSLPNPSILHHAMDLADTAFLDDSPVRLNPDADIHSSLSAAAAMSSVGPLRLPAFQQKLPEPPQLPALAEAEDTAPTVPPKDGVAGPKAEASRSFHEGAAPKACEVAPQELLEVPARHWPANVPRVTLSMLLPSESSMFSNPFTHRSRASESTPRPVYSTLPPRRHIFIHPDHFGEPCLPTIPCAALPFHLPTAQRGKCSKSTPEATSETAAPGSAPARPVDAPKLTPMDESQQIKSVATPTDRLHQAGGVAVSLPLEHATDKEHHQIGTPTLDEDREAVATGGSTPTFHVHASSNPVVPEKMHHPVTTGSPLGHGAATAANLALEATAYLATPSRALAVDISASTPTRWPATAQDAADASRRGPGLRSEGKSSSNVARTGPLAEDSSITELVWQPQLHLCTLLISEFTSHLSSFLYSGKALIFSQ
jgi:hypothetical protein